MSKPTDEEIIQVLRDHDNCMTYVVTHWLRDKYKGTKTAYVLRRLKKLEALGAVSCHRKQWSWYAKPAWFTASTTIRRCQIVTLSICRRFRKCTTCAKERNDEL